MTHILNWNNLDKINYVCGVQTSFLFLYFFSKERNILQNWECILSYHHFGFLNGETFLSIWSLAGKVQTGFLCTEAISFIMEKSKWQQISICKCENFLPFDLENLFAIWIGQISNGKKNHIFKWISFAISTFDITEELLSII